jgi:hypothetical protein
VRASVAAIAILISGCHRNIAVQPPNTDGVRSVVMIEASSDKVLEAYALNIPPDGSAPAWPLLQHHGDTQLYMLQFGCTLDRLNLMPGNPMLLDQAQGMSHFPDPIEKLVTDTAATSRGWTQQSDFPDSIEAAFRRIKLPDDNVCQSTVATFDPKPIVVPDDRHGPPIFAVRIDDTHILAATKMEMAGVDIPTHFYEVDTMGNITDVPVDAPDLKMGDSFIGGYHAPNDEYWLMSQKGLLVRGHLGAPFTTVTSTEVLSRYGPNDNGDLEFQGPNEVAMSGPTTADAPFEIFAAGDDPRTFARFDGARWTRLAFHYKPSSAYQIVFVPATAWVAPQHAIAIGVSDNAEVNTIVRYLDGKTTFEHLPGGSGLAAIAQHPTLGTIVGRDGAPDLGGGGIWSQTAVGQPWTQVPSQTLLYFVRTIYPLGDGFMFEASTEVNFFGHVFGEWFPSTGIVCPIGDLTDTAALAILPVGGGNLAALTLADFEAPLEITLLRQTHEPHECSTRSPAHSP